MTRKKLLTSHSSSGFTLVELAIALMVIGLLIGGVLKGQELIENARITATIRQIKAYDAAILIFRNTYNALPGDIKRPNRIPNCTNEVCIHPGNGNGKILLDGDSYTELFNVFPHMTKAGMIQGPEGGEPEQMDSVMTNNDDYSELFFPATPLNSRRFYLSGGGISPTFGLPSWSKEHIYELNTITGKAAAGMDQKLDDGNPIRGDIVVEDHNGCTPYNSDDDLYEETYKLDETNCSIFLRAGF